MSGGSRRLHAVLRAPLLHFLLGGTILFALQSIALPGLHPAPETTAHSPCADEDDASALSRDEEILLLEALRLGLDDDVVIQRRLEENLSFLGQTAAPAHVVAALRSSDPIVRRRLVQKMRFHLAGTIAVDTPSASEVAAFAAQHSAEANSAETLGVQQIFFSHERRGERARADAQTLLRDLRAEPEEVVQAQADSLPVGLDEAKTLGGVGRYLGGAFVNEVSNAVSDVPPGTWHGPIASPFGYHLVRLDARTTPESGAVAREHAVALRRLHAERRDAAFERRMAELRASYASRAVGDSSACRHALPDTP